MQMFRPESVRRPVVLAALAMALLMAAAGHAQAPDLENMDVVERSVPNGPVAMLNGVPISREAFLGLYRTELASYARFQRTSEVPDGERVKLALHCLARLAQRELLRQEAGKRGVSVSDAEVDQAFAEDLADLRQLVAQREGRTVTEDEALEMAGTTRERMRASVRESLVVDATFRAIAREQGVDVTDAEVEAFYRDRQNLFAQPESVHLRHVYVRPQPTARAASEQAWQNAREKAEQALARIRAGETFEAVARAVSDAPDADRGGDMGALPIEELPPVYQETVARLNEGDMSGVLRSDFGLHIIQIIEKHSSGQVSLEEARPRIRRAIEHSKAEEAVAAWSDPILNDPERLEVFLRLEQTLAARGVTP